MIEGDRANYESYDYNDYDLYGYDDEDTERMKRERELHNELNQIMSELNMTTTQSPLPNPVSLKVSLVSYAHWYASFTCKLRSLVSFAHY